MSRPLATVSAATGLVALGGLGGAALATQPDPSRARPAAASPAPVETRTVVIHRTVHVYRRPKHRHLPVATPAPARTAAPVVAVTPTAPVPTSAPLVSRTSQHAAAPKPLVTRTSHQAAAPKPLVTRTSGAGGHGHGDDGGERGHDD